MPHATPCPPVAELQRYLLGQIPEASAAAMDAHLEDCASCVQSLLAVPARDGLHDLMQASGQLRRPRNAVIEGLVQKLEGLSRTLVLRGPQKNGAQAEIPSASAAVNETIASKTEMSALVTSGPSAVQLTGKPPDNPRDYLAPAQAPDEMGRLGGYRVLKVLGQGGMGVVFLAEDVNLKRRIALKVMRPSVAASPEARLRFVKEAEATAALEHEHIIAIHQIGEERGVPFLAMPLLQGETLEDRLRRDGKVPIAEALRIAREIAEGLAAAHDKDLIHRDIKPVNVWLAQTRVASSGPVPAAELPPRVKILDFGLARSLESDLNLTQTGAIVGTPAYMAPEQARGETLDGRSDLFSLGCVLYRMLTGERPFKGQTPMSQLRSLEMDTPTPPQQIDATIPTPVSQLTMRLLAKNAAERPATAHAVVKWMRAIEGDLTAPAAQPVFPVAIPVKPADEPTSFSLVAFTRLQKMDQWQRGLIAAAVLLLVVSGGFGSWLVFRKLGNTPHGGINGVPPSGKDLSTHFSETVDQRPPHRIAGGKALRIGSLVTKPEPISGIASWTLVTDRFGGIVNEVDFSGDARTMLLRVGGYFLHFDLFDYTLQTDVPAGGGYQSLSPDGKRWVRNAGQRLDIGIVGSKAKPKQLFNFFDGVSDLAWSPDSRFLAIGSPKNMKVFDVEKGGLIDNADWDLPFTTPVIRWSPRGDLLACTDSYPAGNGKTFYLLNPETGEKVKTHTTRGASSHIYWSPTAEYIALVSGSSIDIWKVESWKLVHTISGASTVPAWDRQGRYLAYGLGKQAILYDVQKDEEHASFTAHDRILHCVAFAPNNKTLITSGADQTVRFWSAATWKEPKPELLGTMIYLNTGRILVFSATGHFTGSVGVEQDFYYEYLKSGSDEPGRDNYVDFCKMFNWVNEPKNAGVFVGTLKP